MQTAKTIFVTGATGNQGGAVVRDLLKNGYQLKVLIRNTGSKASRSLAKMNVEIIEGNLDVPESYQHHLKDVDGVFCNLSFKDGMEKEIQQGINLVNFSKKNNVKHFLYSSVIGCDLKTGIPHWESKFKIEKHIKSTGINYTIIRPSSLYENLLIPQVKSSILKGKLVLPSFKNKVQQFISSEDIGKISTIIFSDPPKYSGKILTLAAEEMDGEQMSILFSEVLGKEIKFQQLPMIIVRLFMGKKLATMFRWINNNDAIFVKDLDGLRNEFQGMLSLKEWISINFKK